VGTIHAQIAIRVKMGSSGKAVTIAMMAGGRRPFARNRIEVKH
jgi:hypothetical protein